MPLSKDFFHGDPNVGLFGFATDKYLFSPDTNLNPGPLKVPAVHSTISSTQLCGMFCAGNSHGILVPSITADFELERIQSQMKKFGVKAHRINSKYTALGNLIIANDKAALVSPVLEHHKKEIEETLGVPVTFSNLLDLEIVGSLCVATNKGFLLSMYASDEDFNLLKKVLGTNGDIGTINFGGQFVRSGLIANSQGALIGSRTTGPELARIEEALGFL